MNIAELNELIKKRRAIFPKTYIKDKEIAQDIIEQVLENANYAPTHRLTEPWRFRVLREGALQRLADFLVADYKKNTPPAEQTDFKIKKMSENPLRSGCVIVLIMKRHADLLPEWEEIAAVSMAVQNMWLTCTAYDIGSYWSSPSAITERSTDFLQLADDERCLGLFYMGYHNTPDIPAQRTPVGEKTVWLND
ncbi:MAG: nitroreductase [Saprospiraceae bacterium]|nr:nitroreductase [Saprospiraceae bacterium]